MNHLYYGDNLKVLRDEIEDESVDLIYLDPPFNSNATYNQLFKEPTGEHSASQIEAFDDTWHWNDASEAAFDEVLESDNGLAAEMLRMMRGFLGENDMMAYLAMMAVRMLELHRVLKPTGSLYLHCDPTASHYLKILLDAVFGKANCRNEIVWKRTSSHSDAKKYGAIHDIIFYYIKSKDATWNKVFQPYDQGYVDEFYRFVDEDNRRYRKSDATASGLSGGGYSYEWNGHNRVWRYPLEKMKELHSQNRLSYSKTGLASFKRYLSEGVPLQDLFLDIPPIGARAKERLGYPTQKPVALLERIIQASSNEGDTILDPFCGCGTTIHAAQKLGRKWKGIDITHLAIGLIEKRLHDAFSGIQFETHGTPKDLAGAQRLAKDDKYEFEKWALSLINAQPGNQGKKGADGGFDGNKYFGDKGAHRALISVKGGKNVGVGMVRDLDSVVKRLNADIGILLTLTPPTKPMEKEAASARRFEVEGFSPVPRLQIVTIEQALELRERALKLPFFGGDDNFKRADKEDMGAQKQTNMDV